MAGGFTVSKEKIEAFREYLIKSLLKSEVHQSKVLNLYLDSAIAPSALNEDFYEQINYLAPFGPGNNEPKFVIENLKIISSDVINNNHIRSILLGKDGSIVKSFAWNAINGPLEPYLNKKNKKKIDVAGKMKLNEWRGKKNIDFIIEDVALS